jgi:hypothetical protein
LSCARAAAKTFVSARLSLIHTPIANSAADSRNGTRQPQAWNDSGVMTRAEIHRTPLEGICPIAVPVCGHELQKPQCRGSRFTATISTVPPLAAYGEAVHEPAQDEEDQGQHAHRRVRRQQADRECRGAHQDQAGD